MNIIESALHEYLGGRIGYAVRTVDSIAMSKSGKFRLVIDRTGQHPDRTDNVR